MNFPLNGSVTLKPGITQLNYTLPYPIPDGSYTVKLDTGKTAVGKLSPDSPFLAYLRLAISFLPGTNVNVTNTSRIQYQTDFRVGPPPESSSIFSSTFLIIWWAILMMAIWIPRTCSKRNRDD